MPALLHSTWAAPNRSSVNAARAATADSEVYRDGRWNFEGHDDKRSLHYIAGGAFFSIGEQFNV